MTTYTDFNYWLDGLFMGSLIIRGMARFAFSFFNQGVQKLLGSTQLLNVAAKTIVNIFVLLTATIYNNEYTK
jgi:hypothetical protein